jgi:hypothetical protein
MHSEMLMRPKPTVHLDAHLKILGTEVASFGSRFKCQWAANAHGIAEFKRRMFDVFLCDEVFGNRPAFEIAAKDQLGFYLKRVWSKYSCGAAVVPE